MVRTKGKTAVNNVIINNRPPRKPPSAFAGYMIMLAIFIAMPVVPFVVVLIVALAGWK